MRLKPAAALTALLASVAVAAGQPPAGKADPAEKFEPKSAPGEGQKFLTQFAGDWAVTKTFYLRAPAGKPTVTAGKCHQKMVQGGRFLQSDFTFDGPTGPTTGTGVIGFEPASGLFTSSWIDSRQTRMSIRRAREKFDGKQIVLYGTPLDGVKVPSESKTVTTVEGNSVTKITHRQYSVAADGTERPVMQLELTRAKSE
jgi:hypothetical protein